MTALAQRTGAINLGQGFPDTDGPEVLLRVAAEAMRSGHNQYPPLNGVAPLREAIAEQRLADYGTGYDPDAEVVVTAGATEGVTAAICALAGPGDEVLYFDPGYDSYPPAIALAGATPRTVPLRPVDGRFTFDPADLAAAIGPRTRVIVVNTPHNPTGTVFTRAELDHIAWACLRHGLVAITDEVYEHLTYDGVAHVPLASRPGMSERTLVVSSAGKAFNATGWKVGWVCGPEHLVRAVRTVKQYLTFASGTPFQHAVAAALRERDDWLATLTARLTTARDLMVDALTGSGWRCYACEGTYFLQADAVELGYPDGTELCLDLAYRGGVVAIPSAALHADPRDGAELVRIAFCKAPEVVETAAQRLVSFTTVPRLRGKGARPCPEPRTHLPRSA
ncbi:aminotransferase class I/II-fold pyridoxal phosphate-dependent enzyme [Actinokineospora auranticolor]|nr:aminotransferase class I/II-fold pyridoxal phosphate-dependent enzyme [Actinokineospora auranticolor]